ncbi:MAG: osmotically inducible protein OsmC [Planctomycetes bacterium]|nr:osmotically inducible protein OsmC [Planctomycetota bacterium]
MVEIDVVYEGDLHTEALHGPSGNTLTTDAPKDNEGRGESFSPTDLVATALGTCMITIMGIAARRKGLALEGARVRVRKLMTMEPVRRIGKLEVVFDLPAGLSEADRAVLERAALACPVHKSLHPDTEIPVTFNYGS